MIQFTIVYEGSNEQYYTFCTPECACFIDSYLEYRTKNGEKINNDYYLIRDKFTELWIKNTNLICMPSRNVRDIRGFTDISYLFIDEADYFEPSVNNELLHAITAHEEKSNCTTIMVSTPNRPGGLFESIEKDSNSKYCKIVLDYTVGLDKIYDRKEIEKKMNEPEFPREYWGQYLGRVGICPLTFSDSQLYRIGPRIFNR